MPQIARVTDTISTGHGCDSTSTIAGHAQNCYAEGLQIARKTDAITVHTVPRGPACVNHTAIVNVGSGTVYVEGLQCARLNDSADAGHITGYAPSIFVGD